MARAFNGTSQYASVAKGYLAGSTGDFTVNFWMKQADTSGAQVPVFSGADIDVDSWGIFTQSGSAYFFSVVSGNPDFLAAIPLDATDQANGVWLAFRKQAGSGAWDVFKNGARTQVSAGTSFTLATVGAGFAVAASLPEANYFNGAVAEVAIWNTALANDQMTELHAAVAADVVAPGALLGYWPLRGNSDPELNYAVRADALTLTAAPAKATHPTIVPPKIADVVEPSWIVDLVHPDLGTIRAASRSVTTEYDWDVLGAAYPEQLSDDINLIEEMPSVGLSVMEPATTVVKILNAKGTFLDSQDWNAVPVTIRYYDRVSHAFETKFSGLVSDQDISNVRAVLTCANQDAAILDQMVPRAVMEQTDNTDGIVHLEDDPSTTRRDIGAPIPVPMGDGGFEFPTYIDYSAGTATIALNGHDLLVGFGGAYVVRKVLFDSDRQTAGLEPGTLWASANLDGEFTLARISGSVFTVTGVGVDAWFESGRPVRSSNNAGTTWNYSHVSSVNFGTAGGTVTLATSILGGSLGTVQTASDYAVFSDKYHYVGAGGTTALTTLRFYGDTSSAIVVQVGDASRGNPADAIRFILNDPDVGLNQPVNAASFDQARTDFSDAGLGSAVRDVLGCDKQQRRAREVCDELGSLRRVRLWRDADTAEWHIVVDKDPGASVATFEFGPGTRGNVAEMKTNRPTPSANAVATVKLRYERLGRDRGAKSMELTDYQFHAIATALAYGKEQIFTNPWLRSTAGHLEPAIVCYFIAKTLRREGRRIEFVVRHQGRRIQLGDIVTLNLMTSPGNYTTGDWRVVKIERDLAEFTFTVAGPWQADVFTTDSTTVNLYVATPTGDANPDEREVGVASDGNLILNSDWTGGLRKQTWDDIIDVEIIPAWGIVNGSQLSALSVTVDPQAKGGAYLSATTVASPSGEIIISPFNQNDPFDSTNGFTSVRPRTNYIFSVYTAALAGLQLRLLWLLSGGGQIGTGFVNPPMFLAPGDVTGLGWRRTYVFASAPPGAASCFIYFVLKGLPGAPATYRFDAVQFEEATRLSLRPTQWKRNNQYGIHPTAVIPGDFLVRGTGEAEHGTKISTPSILTPIALSGSGTVTLGTVQAGIMTGVSGRVATGIAGATAWKVALNYGGGTVQAVTGNLGTAVNTTFGDAERTAGMVTVKTPTELVAIAVGGTAFSAGAVRVTPHMMQHVPPSV